MHLSQREILEINERIVANQVGIEKISACIEQTQDPDIRHMMEHHRNIYNQHGQVLMNFLRGGMGR
ncbi:MAG: hypothetical protein AB1576_13760 [Bacillota bacterium]